MQPNLRTALATAARFARVTAELGGKTPIAVFDDIDPVAAAEGAAFAAFVAAGQSCVAGSRFLVQRGIYDAFVDALAARANAIRIGDPALAALRDDLLRRLEGWFAERCDPERDAWERPVTGWGQDHPIWAPVTDVQRYAAG